MTDVWIAEQNMGGRWVPRQMDEGTADVELVAQWLAGETLQYKDFTMILFFGTLDEETDPPHTLVRTAITGPDSAEYFCKCGIVGTASFGVPHTRRELELRAEFNHKQHRVRALIREEANAVGQTTAR